MTLYSQLKEFQKEVVDKNLLLIENVLKKNKSIYGRQVTISPTGSGKTFMMASLIESGLKIYPSINFIWLTHNKQILIQTQNEIRKNLGNQVITAYEIEQQIESFLARVLLFNIQKGISKKAKNWLKRWKHVQALHQRPTILIIDEADEGMSGKNMESLREILDPILELGFTASFKKKNNEFEYIKVSYKDVINAKMLVKEVLYQASDEISRKEIIERAIAQRQSLEEKVNLLKQYDPERFFVPKMLIQAPAKDCEDMARELNSFLKLDDHDFQEQVIIHTQNSRGLDEIEDIAYVRYIVGDLMIERGWNCPEAYVLLSTKESVSKSKGIQLLGRVIRLPKSKPFDDEFDELNKGYVYISGKHSIEESCKNFINELPVLAPPKEILQIEIRKDIAIPPIKTFTDRLEMDIEDERLRETSELICDSIEELYKKCEEQLPSIRQGTLNLDEEVSVNSQINKIIEVEWNIEMVKRTLIDALSAHIPRNYANLIITKYQIRLKEIGGLSKIAPSAKYLSKMIRESRNIRDISTKLSYMYEEYIWPPFKLIMAYPHPHEFKNSLYPKVQLNNEELDLAKFIDKICAENDFKWVRNDMSNIKLFKGHYPDFIVFNKSKFVFIEFKGQHLLFSIDTRYKNLKGQMTAPYLLVYLEKDTGEFMVKGRDGEVDQP
ncbi:TPA: DEAD/DEAH box helicase, partial [Legionella pneumophila]